MKQLLLLIILLLLGACHPMNQNTFVNVGPSWDTEMIEDSMDAVCIVAIYETANDITTRQSRGTGFVVSHNGYVITNDHVVNGILELEEPLIQLEFENGETYTVLETKMVPHLDIAVMKIDAHSMHFLEFEFQQRLHRGDSLLSFGNPYPFTFAVSEGIVSSLHTQFDDDNKFLWIQSDIAVNFGCSGGPVINHEGKVVGINQALMDEMHEVSLLIPVTALQDYFQNYYPQFL